MVNVLSGRGGWRGWGGRDSAIEGEEHFQRGGSGCGWGGERGMVKCTFGQRVAWTTSVLGGSASEKLACTNWSSEVAPLKNWHGQLWSSEVAPLKIGKDYFGPRR